MYVSVSAFVYIAAHVEAAGQPSLPCFIERIFHWPGTDQVREVPVSVSLVLGIQAQTTMSSFILKRGGCGSGNRTQLIRLTRRNFHQPSAVGLECQHLVG